jgi:hypothetical protein
MPRLIPDADDLARMTPSQKAKVRRYIAQVALELDDYAHLSLSAKAAQRHREVVGWAEQVRNHARALEVERPPEPAHITHARRQALLDAIR